VQGHTEKIEAVQPGDDPSEPVMRQLGKYEIHEKIGEGGFGIVYKGFDPFIKRFVAIKTCNSPDKAIRDRYFREAEIAGRLDHPHIVRIFDFGVANDTPFLVQEFLAGGDLDHKILGAEFVPFPERLLYLMHIARGLDYAHSQGVIHRDIKPANIRILEDGTAKIMDFGVAMLQSSDHRLTEVGMTVGTAAYLAPEQIKGQATDRRTDIFSFGILAYELLSGQRPFDQDNISATLYAIIHDDPKPFTLPDSICPDAMHQLILDCLEKHPEGRPPDFSTVLRRLEAVRRGMRLKGGSRDFDSELRRAAPKRSDDLPVRGNQRELQPRTGSFDPPLQKEWTPNSIRLPERGAKRTWLILVALLIVTSGSYAWMASQSLVPVPRSLRVALSPPDQVEPSIGPAENPTEPTHTDSLISESGQTATDESDSAIPDLTANEDSLEPPAPELDTTDSTAQGTPEPEPVAAPPVPQDATVFLTRSWHDQITVAIDGGEPLRLSSTRSYRVEPGAHSFAYALVTPDYRAFETVRVNLEPGQERRIETPIPRPGFLTIQANLGSPQGLIQIGKQTLGASPLRNLKLRPGRHKLGISSPADPNLPLSETTVDIKSSRETVVTFDLTGQRDVSIRYRDLDP
jgi:serine/threonine protein kinase